MKINIPKLIQEQKIMKYRLKQKNSSGLQPQYQLAKGGIEFNFPAQNIS